MKVNISIVTLFLIFSYTCISKSIVFEGQTTIPKFLYTSQEFEYESNTYNYRLRFFKSTYSKFFGPDLLKEQHGAYTMVRNNPVSYIDPTGMCHMCPGNNNAMHPHEATYFSLYDYFRNNNNLKTDFSKLANKYENETGNIPAYKTILQQNHSYQSFLSQKILYPTYWKPLHDGAQSVGIQEIKIMTKQIKNETEHHIKYIESPLGLDANPALMCQAKSLLEDPAYSNYIFTLQQNTFNILPRYLDPISKKGYLLHVNCSNNSRLVQAAGCIRKVNNLFVITFGSGHFDMENRTCDIYREKVARKLIQEIQTVTKKDALYFSVADLSPYNTLRFEDLDLFPDDYMRAIISNKLNIEKNVKTYLDNLYAPHIKYR